MSQWAVFCLLLVGVADDLLYRKFHNSLFIVVFVVLLASLPFTSQPIAHLQGFLAAIVIYWSLFNFGVIGGGDAKLMFLFGLATSAVAVVETTVYAFLWGGVYIIIYATLKGQFLKTLQQTVPFLRKGPLEKKRMLKIPFTVPLFLGWLTYLKLYDLGVKLV